MAATSGYTSSTRGGIALAAGVLFIGSSRFGVAKGEFSFDPGRRMGAIDVPNATAKIRGLDFVQMYEPKITGTLVELNTTQLQYLELNATASGSPSTITPVSGLALFPDDTTRYLSNVRVVWDRQDGNFIRVTFASAILESYTLRGAVGGPAEAQVTFAARLVPSGSPLDVTVAPYTIEIASTTP